MSRFEVLGVPDPGLPPRYRGTSRKVPLVLEELGLSHPTNQVLLEVLRRHPNEEDLTNVDLARRLAREYRPGPEVEPFEVVEITRSGERPQSGNTLLGFDVPWEGGTYSLLANILLWSDTSGAHAADSAETSARVGSLRHRFADRLNENLLFHTEAEAGEFRDAAVELGPWEGPGFEWEVVGVWSVPQSAPSQPGGSGH
jgi:hypothetical protein